MIMRLCFFFIFPALFLSCEHGFDITDEDIFSSKKIRSDFEEYGNDLKNTFEKIKTSNNFQLLFPNISLTSIRFFEPQNILEFSTPSSKKRKVSSKKEGFNNEFHKLIGSYSFEINENNRATLRRLKDDGSLIILYLPERFFTSLMDMNMTVPNLQLKGVIDQLYKISPSTITENEIRFDISNSRVMGFEENYIREIQTPKELTNFRIYKRGVPIFSFSETGYYAPKTSLEYNTQTISSPYVTFHKNIAILSSNTKDLEDIFQSSTALYEKIDFKTYSGLYGEFTVKVEVNLDALTVIPKIEFSLGDYKITELISKPINLFPNFQVTKEELYALLERQNYYISFKGEYIGTAEFSAEHLFYITIEVDKQLTLAELLGNNHLFSFVNLHKDLSTSCINFQRLAKRLILDLTLK